MRNTSKVLLWKEELRLHHWVKNVLVFIPAIADHSIFERGILVSGMITFVLFSITASTVYLINDLFDLESDQKHPTKRFRPLAAGLIRKSEVLLVAVTLLVVGLFASYVFSPSLFLILSFYLVLNLAYSVKLKKIPILDVLVLAIMYEIRILAGGETSNIQPSTWLLSSSAFFFMSMAFSKRHAELSRIDTTSSSVNTQRGYRTEDIQLLKILGIVSGFSCVVIFNLYINDESTISLYSNPQFLLFLMPFLLYVICDKWLEVHRNESSEDPILDLLVNVKILACIPIFIVIILFSL